jgi:hypothetical protein
VLSTVASAGVPEVESTMTGGADWVEAPAVPAVAVAMVRTDRVAPMTRATPARRRARCRSGSPRIVMLGPALPSVLFVAYGSE